MVCITGKVTLSREEWASRSKPRLEMVEHGRQDYTSGFSSLSVKNPPIPRPRLLNGAMQLGVLGGKRLNRRER